MSYAAKIAGYTPQNEQEKNDQRIITAFIHAHPQTVLTRDNELAHITSSGFVVNASVTQVLMVHHNIRNTWSWTGGHADGNPDLLQVAIREAQEETGAAHIRPLCSEIASLDILTVHGHMKKGKYVSSHLHLSVAYLLVCDEAAALAAKPDENSGVRWFALSEINETNFLLRDVLFYQKLIKRAKGLAV